MPSERPLPESDTAARPFWEGAQNHKLLIQRCKDCDNYQWYPKQFCIACGGRNLEMVEAGGRGSIYSFTVIYRGPYDDIASPYAVAIVTLDEGVRLLSNIVNADPNALRCEMPVQVTYQPLRDGVVLPVFEPRPGR